MKQINQGVEVETCGFPGDIQRYGLLTNSFSDEVQVMPSAEELTEIYERVFPLVAKLVRDQGGSFEDARDIFHDSFLIYLETISKRPGTVRTSDSAYITGIARHLLAKRYGRRYSFNWQDNLEDMNPVPEDFYPSVNEKRLLRFLEAAGKKCMDLLRAAYYKKQDMKKLAIALGYSNEHSVSVQKYKCIERVRKSIKERSLSYEDFME